MATFEIVASAAPYYTVTVRFGEQEFTQQITSTKTGKALTTQLQAYADEYEAEWTAVAPQEPTEQG